MKFPVFLANSSLAIIVLAATLSLRNNSYISRLDPQPINATSEADIPTCTILSPIIVPLTYLPVTLVEGASGAAFTYTFSQPAEDLTQEGAQYQGAVSCAINNGQLILRWNLCCRNRWCYDHNIL
ncbi:hypothetical protein M422DRAFT_269319 [Sphaerobolus stellatus SS14]|uniref:Unplaced genomic scaffold SPHSTscaffold_210, whole genome shotgun sequence n=1 Tax=Sphaerobolus stellatus (strain SS14) TaxID=990650 RepID=A0A0C9UW45_SPHS4|nr:hypothetical protein M422DRAFT_269319 [Sphaerobolus stellatus SS14]